MSASSASIVRRLILKDLYLVRWMIAGSLVAGAVAIAMMTRGRMSSYVGGVSLICTFIILNIFVVMGNVVQERKDKVQLFLLSLPISPMQYTAAKVLSSSIAFVGPWLVLSAAVLVVIDVSPLPNGVIPFWVAVLAYLFMYYCALLAVALVVDSTGWHATAITLGNLSVNFLIPILLGLPSVSGHIEGPIAVWTSDVITILTIEMVLGVAALCLAWYARSRAADFV
jgi:ABC-2 type transport system permease protein